MPVIRPFRMSDIREVISISRITLREDYPEDLYISISDSWNGVFLVALENTSVVGFINGLMENDGVCRVLMLAVRPDRYRRGIGGMLLSDMVKIFERNGSDRIILEVRPSNLNAIDFYRKRGFKSVGIIKDFYNDGEDGIRMIKYLSGKLS